LHIFAASAAAQHYNQTVPQTTSQTIEKTVSVHPISWFIENPVKVSVGIILLTMFGVLAMFRMPMQLAPNVERPSISIQTQWPGASPQEVEKEIVNEQEEKLKSVEGVTKMSSSSSDSQGEVNLEFRVGTDMNQAVLKVNSQLQQVRDYPVDADKPVIRTSNSADRAIAWFILSVRPPTDQQLLEFAESKPEARSDVESILAARSVGLASLRLRRMAEKFPEARKFTPDIVVPEYRKFAEDIIEAQFERVPGVAGANVIGGKARQMQVIVEAEELAARGLTLENLRQALILDNQDVSGGDFSEGKRRYVVRTLGQYRSAEQVAQQTIPNPSGETIYVGDVAKVKLGFEKTTGFVRRFGESNIAINVQQESGANVIEVMEGLKKEVEKLNASVLARQDLVLTQVYDETKYIKSAVGLVNQNIVLGGSLTIIVLMLFLHLRGRTLIFVPMLAATAIAAILLSPWFFLITIALVLTAGIWFARGTLVVAVAIPVSIIGTFLILNGLGRSLNVISLAGLAFAVGMLVDNAVVVLENVFRYYQMGHTPMKAARFAVGEVWGAVLASTLTTLAVFLPVLFLQGEAGQLFADIALAISAAVGLSLIVSVIVIPTAAARILSDSDRGDHPERKKSRLELAFKKLGAGFTNWIVNVNRWIQSSWARRLAVVGLILAVAALVSYLMMPKVEYLPSGNRNLVISLILPPPGYNIDQLVEMGETVEEELKPYWDVDPEIEDISDLDYPAIGDYFYVARGRSVFVGLRAYDPLKARRLIDLIQDKLRNRFEGSFVTASQSSLFGRGLSGGRTIDVEITGPELEKLVGLGGQILGGVKQHFPPSTQARPEPSLDLSSPEMHVTLKPEQAAALGVTSRDLGYAVNVLVDGAYATDYFVGGEKIDLVILANEDYVGSTDSIKSEYIATPNLAAPVRLDALAHVDLDSGPEQINHRERERAISIQVSPPPEISLEEAIETLESKIIAPLIDQGQLTAEYKINLSGTADKLNETWSQLKWNFLLAILITYLLMAALFESWIYPFVIILSVPMGAVGGLIGLKLLGYYLMAQGEPPQTLDVLTMLGFVILVGTVVNNAILIVHQSLVFMKQEGLESRDAISQSIRTRIRPIFMTTATTVFGLSPLVFFPGAGSELYRGLGSVVLGGLLLSTFFTLILVPTLFSLMIDFKKLLFGKRESKAVQAAPVDKEPDLETTPETAPA
jgi:HAE1 family hydrophobic/amphiphilic exporter-1